MKSYTDLEQSKKLSEFLSLDSADMYYMETSCNNYTIGVLQRLEKDMLLKQAEYYKMLPCWSLAALLDALPLEIETHKQTDGNKIYYYVESYMKRIGKEIHLSTERHENLVDVCYEMIIKLHEMNLL